MSDIPGLDEAQAKYDNAHPDDWDEEPKGKNWWDECDQADRDLHATRDAWWDNARGLEP